MLIRSKPEEAPYARDTQRRTLQVLRVTQILGGVGQAVGGSAGALLARQITGDDGRAGWPQAAITTGAAVAAVVASAVAERTSRRRSLSAALMLGALGAGVAALSARANSFSLLIIGNTLLGGGNAAVMLSRYAATDLAPSERRGRAIASVLFATSVGAAAGPNLLAPTTSLAHAVGLATFAGPYVAAGVMYVAAAATLVLALTPDPLRLARALNAGSPEDEIATGTVKAILVRQDVGSALGALMLANAVMVGLMTMAPLELLAMGQGLGVIGGVVSVHIAAMFAPAPISGRLSDRLGTSKTIGIGGILYLGAATLAAAAVHNMPLLAIAMLLLGAAWNVTVIAASAQLTQDALPQTSPRLEALGELLMGISAAVAGILAGAIVLLGGYVTLGLLGVAAAAPLIIALRPKVLQRVQS